MSEAPQPAPSPPRWRRFLPLAVLLAGLVLVVASGGHRALSWEALAARHADLRASIATHPGASAAVFITFYALAAAISLPGALWFTIASGVLFGWAFGAVYAWVGATFGATLAFLAARSAFQGLIRGRVGGRLEAFKAGFERDAFTYLLMLRIAPAPFFLVNVAPAFFAVRLSTFVIATAIGIVPATILYAAIGAQAGEALSRREPPDLSLLGDPRLWAAAAGLLALAASPLIMRALRRRAGAITKGTPAARKPD